MVFLRTTVVSLYKDEALLALFAEKVNERLDLLSIQYYLMLPIVFDLVLILRLILMKFLDLTIL